MCIVVKKMFSLSPIVNNNTQTIRMLASPSLNFQPRDVPITGFYIATSSEHGFWYKLNNVRAAFLFSSNASSAVVLNQRE